MANQMFFAALAGGNADAAAEWEENAYKWRKYAEDLEVKMIELKHQVAEQYGRSEAKSDVLEKLIPDYKDKFPGGEPAIKKIKEKYKENLLKTL